MRVNVRKLRYGYIYCTADGKFKIFHSHARDSFGIPHPQGTCVLLEVNTLNELINHFKIVYQNAEVRFELTLLNCACLHYMHESCMQACMPRACSACMRHASKLAHLYACLRHEDMHACDNS